MAKKKLNEYTSDIPDDQRRRGSFVVRIALQRVAQHQHRDALKAASRMVLALPLIQGALLVGVLNAQYWMLLLAMEGLVIAWLSASQLSKPNPESKLIGYGIALLNALLLGAAGLFLGSHIYWLTGLLGMVAVTLLVFRTTGRRTVKLSWLTFAAPLLLLTLVAGAGRLAIELSKTETDAASRARELQVAWLVFQVRGGNGSERALLRLRQSQTAFEQGDYQQAFEFADDGVFNPDRRMRSIPQSEIGQNLLDSLLKMKAQSYYNRRWDKQEEIFTPIRPETLEAETLADPTVKVRWGW